MKSSRTKPSSTARLAALIALVALPWAARAQDDSRCGAGKDLIVQALERASPTSPASDFEDALQLLKRAAAVCSQLGDAWYYRSLVEARLNHGPQLVKFSADKARLLGSGAMTQGLQPFVLATPGVTRRGIPGGGGTNPTPTTPAATTAGPVQQKWALVIGISAFADRVVPKLNYTAADASAFAAILADPAVGRFPKANIHTLTDAQATTRAIRTELNWIARHAGPDDLVVIYVATHGLPRETDSVGQLNYLLTYDTEIKSLQNPDEDSIYATALPMIDLSNTVSTRMKSLRTLVVLDTCYSGGATKNASRMMGKLSNAAPTQANLDRMSQGSGRIVFAAARDDQESLESDALQHGYFTYFLLKTLKESKGLQPLSQVFASVQQQVSDRVAADNKAEHLQQNPVMDRSADDADFALGLAPGGGQ
jgi:uncharacterized caspase-like protein